MSRYLTNTQHSVVYQAVCLCVPMQLLLWHCDEDGGVPSEGCSVAGGPTQRPALPGRSSRHLRRGQGGQEAAPRLEPSRSVPFGKAVFL